MCHQITAIALAVLLAVWGSANDHKYEVDGSAPHEAPIEVTINPESRVSVALVGPLPPAAPCGVVTKLRVSIANYGFLTARLEATLVGTLPAGVTVFLQPDPLKGVAYETRNLLVKLTRPGLLDLTIALKPVTPCLIWVAATEYTF